MIYPFAVIILIASYNMPQKTVLGMRVLDILVK